MHEFLVVMQVEGVEVGALATFDLLDAQDLALQQLDRLAGAGLQHEFGDHLTAAHCAGSVLFSARRAAAYSRSASRTSDTRSGATPCAMVRSINSSCCWFNRSLTTASVMKIPLSGNQTGQILYTVFAARSRFPAPFATPPVARQCPASFA